MTGKKVLRPRGGPEEQAAAAQASPAQETPRKRRRAAPPSAIPGMGGPAAQAAENAAPELSRQSPREPQAPLATSIIDDGTDELEVTVPVAERILLVDPTPGADPVVTPVAPSEIVDSSVLDLYEEPIPAFLRTGPVGGDPTGSVAIDQAVSDPSFTEAILRPDDPLGESVQHQISAQSRFAPVRAQDTGSHAPLKVVPGEGPGSVATTSAKPRTDPLAWTALVVSLVGFGTLSFLAVLFAHGARYRIRHDGTRGEKAATAALVLGYVGLMAMALAVAAYVLVQGSQEPIVIAPGERFPSVEVPIGQTGA